MHPLVLVALGGAIGSVARAILMARFNPSPADTSPARWAGLPIGTLTVNLVGSLAIGLLAGWLASRPADSQNLWRNLLIAGLLGGFTTFSAFGIESLQLLKSGAWATAGFYMLASTIGGLALAAGGYALTAGR